MQRLILLALAAVPVIAGAVKTDAYVLDRFENLVRDSQKRCIRTGTWAPEKALPECGDVAAPAVEPTMQPLPGEVSAPKIEEPETATSEPNVEMNAMALPSENVFFHFDKSELTPDAKVALDDLADRINKANYNMVLISGYADIIGTAPYNAVLSQKRAYKVAEYLDSKGVTIPMAYIGRGELARNEENCTGLVGDTLKHCYRGDRRATIEIQ